MNPAIARTRFLHVAGSAAASLLAPGAARAQTAPGAATIRVLIAPSDGVTAVVYAKHAGLFEKAGLDVTLDTQHNGAAVAAGVASGNYDIGNSSVTSILLAHERGLPFTLIAPAGIYREGGEPSSGAIALKDSPLRFGADANGGVIGVVSLNGLGQEAFCAWIDAHGGDWTSVHFIELPYTESGAALLAHRVIAAESVLPALTTFLASPNFRFVPTYGAIAPAYLMSTWFTTRDFSTRNPDVVRRFSRVVAEAATYANAHHAETAPIMADFTKIPLLDMEHMPRAIGGVTLSPTLIQPMITAAAKYGNLKKPFPAQELIDSNAVT
jgi:NitT/TauT family transport system substrate-binding protein